MTLPSDKEVRLRCYRNALQNWRLGGTLEFNRRALDWTLRELVDYSLPDLRRLLYEYVEQGGVIDERVERRPEYVHYEFHYDLRVTIDGRRIYFETILLCVDPDDFDDPMIKVVNIHNV